MLNHTQAVHSKAGHSNHYGSAHDGQGFQDFLNGPKQKRGSLTFVEIIKKSIIIDMSTVICSYL